MTGGRFCFVNKRIKCARLPCRIPIKHLSLLLSLVPRSPPRYVASYLMRRYGLVGLREIGERVGLHFSAVGNAVKGVTSNPTRAMAQSLKALGSKLKN